MKSSGLLNRTLVGAGLLVVVAVALLSPRPEPLALLVAAWSVLATLEFVALLRIAEIELSRWLVPALNALVVAAAYLGWLPGFIIAPVAVIFIAAVAVRHIRPRNPVYGTFTLIYLGFLPAHLVMLRGLSTDSALSPWLVFVPLVVTWVSDTAAYFVGRLLGRHPLAPTISPKKTIEGLAAGLVAGAVLAAVWLRVLDPFRGQQVWWLAACGIGLSAVGQAGDLFESIFKRAVGVKDSGSTLGEHGGFLDRADSLLFTIPAFYYLVLALV